MPAYSWDTVQRGCNFLDMFDCFLGRELCDWGIAMLYLYGVSPWCSSAATCVITQRCLSTAPATGPGAELLDGKGFAEERSAREEQAEECERGAGWGVWAAERAPLVSLSAIVTALALQLWLCSVVIKQKFLFEEEIAFWGGNVTHH